MNHNNTIYQSKGQNAIIKNIPSAEYHKKD